MPDLATIIMGGFIGIASVAFAFDLRRKFASAQQREREFQKRAERTGGDHA